MKHTNSDSLVSAHLDPSQLAMTLAARIKQLRRTRRLAQPQLAELVGISRSYVSRLESDRIGLPSKRVLWALAEALDTTPDDLLTAAGYLPSRDPILCDPGLEIAFRYVATLPEGVWRKVLDFVADVSRQHVQHLQAPSEDGEKPGRSELTSVPE